MFYLSYLNSIYWYYLLEGRFAPFDSESCKLPSFCATIKTFSGSQPQTLDTPDEVGEFCFFKPDDNGYWISYRGSFVHLTKDMTGADVYVPEIDIHSGFLSSSYLLMQAYMYRLVETGAFMIHSAAAVFEDSGILFCGASGAGKSTQANLWEKYTGAHIINYDKPCVLPDNGEYIVHGSPWSGKENRFINEHYPIKAIVFVVQAERCSIKRISSANAYSNLYLHNYVYPFTPDMDRKYSSVILGVAEKVPVYELSCDISETAVETLYNELFGDKSYNERKKGAANEI